VEGKEKAAKTRRESMGGERDIAKKKKQKRKGSDGVGNNRRRRIG
jgi:hypothetical protein